MKTFREYWTFSSIRGALTILASICIVAIPFEAAQVLSLPILAALAVDILATYFAIDAATTILLRFELPSSARHRNALFAKTALSLITAGSLYVVAYGGLPITFAAWIVAGNAALTAVLEWNVARDTKHLYRDTACFATAGVAAMAAVALPFAARLNASDLALALATWVGLYGTTQLALGSRMLFVEYRAEHPAAAFDSSWKQMMSATPRPHYAALQALSVEHCGTCATCPAEVLCTDDSLRGQVASVMAGRQPLIVRASQISRVLEAAHV